jgi:hypothetical protein
MFPFSLHKPFAVRMKGDPSRSRDLLGRRGFSERGRSSWEPVGDRDKFDLLEFHHVSASRSLGSNRDADGHFPRGAISTVVLRRHVVHRRRGLLGGGLRLP